MIGSTMIGPLAPSAGMSSVGTSELPVATEMIVRWAAALAATLRSAALAAFTWRR